MMKCFTFSFKKSRQTNLFQVPNGAPVERDTRSQGTIYISLETLMQIPLNKNFFPSLKGPKKRASLHVSHQRGPYGNRYPLPEPYLTYLSGSPVKESFLQVFLMDPPRREMPRS